MHTQINYLVFFFFLGTSFHFINMFYSEFAGYFMFLLC